MKRAFFISLVLSFVVVCARPTSAQEDNRHQLLYGAAYYHEYMPRGDKKL